MDRNTLTAMLLMAVLLIGFMWVTQPEPPTPEEIAARQLQEEADLRQVQEIADYSPTLLAEEVEEIDFDQERAERQNLFGAFADASIGEEIQKVVETNDLRITFSNKGGRIAAVELPHFRTHDSLPLFLFNGEEEGLYGFTFITANNRVVSTTELYFEALPVVRTDSSQIVTMRLNAGEGSHLDFIYNIPDDNYMLSFEVVANNMEDVLSAGMREMELQWSGKIRQQERNRSFESRHSTIFYKFVGDGVESLSATGSDNRRVHGNLRWVAFKNQFFSTVLIADEFMTSPEFQIVNLDAPSQFLKECFVRANVPFNLRETNRVGFRFYFGPNHFQTLRNFDADVASADRLQLERLVPLGWGLFRWVNQLMIIPMFNFFGNHIDNYGIIILLMTFVIKFLMFPLTFKSYMSTARMRVLKPEIDKINEKIPETKPQDRQRATMELYRQAGVNPLGGCLPILLQMPILIALFSFFPSSIELRQQSFLWADDLSTYDSILDLPFTIPFYGSHVSLFCLLMTIVNVIYTRMNMANQNTGAQQMPGMKVMLYLMPVMLLFFFNSFASGLSYYYLVSLLITIGQTYAIRMSVNEEKLFAKLMENKKKPKKKSGFLARLEEAQRQQQKQIEQQKKKKKK